MEHILSLSYGKDSLACLGAIEQLGWPLDRIVHAEVWATDTIPADLPPMVEFKATADEIIYKRWDIRVEHFRADVSYEEQFYRARFVEKLGVQRIYGFPIMRGQWCNSLLKMAALAKANKASKAGTVHYIGIAADEPNRFHNLQEKKRSPLVEAGWTEAMCREWCEKNDLLSPIYTTSTRGAAGSATIKEWSSCASCAKPTRNIGSCCSNGTATALLPLNLTGIPYMISRNVSSWKMSC